MSEKKSSFSLEKKLKISKAQQVLLLSVLASSAVLGVGISLSLNFLSQISFNAKVIMEKDKAIVSYSEAISKIGVCRSPKGETYSEDELKNCTPSTIDVNDIPGTLRYNIINNLAVSPSLNSVPKVGVDIHCVNPDTFKNYTIKELNDKYIYAESIEERDSATNLIKTCSALRTIPDALPAYENQEAMLSSLNKIFNISGWTPDGLSPSADSYFTTEDGINAFEVAFSMDADLPMVQTVLNNIEKSIREIDFTGVQISYDGKESLRIEMMARAFFVNKTLLNEEPKTINPSSAKESKE